MKSQKVVIGVIGGCEVTQEILRQAYEVGKHVALNQAVLVCGGLGGVMEAASQGAHENGGLVIGMLPGDDRSRANSFVHIAIPTAMGTGRNLMVVAAAQVLIAFPGSYGTLSEMSLALTTSKPVIYMPGAWNLKKIGAVDSALFKEAFDAPQAVGLALNAIR
jgi:uncharacterized protein (TIGR00725 family)